MKIIKTQIFYEKQQQQQQQQHKLEQSIESNFH